MSKMAKSAKKINKKDMLASKTRASKKYPILYAYAAISILASLPFQLQRLSQIHDSAATIDFPTAQIIATIAGMAIGLSLYLYLALGKKLNWIIVILRIILVLQSLGVILSLLSNVSSYDFILSLMLTLFTYYVYMIVTGKKTFII